MAWDQRIQRSTTLLLGLKHGLQILIVEYKWSYFSLEKKKTLLFEDKARHHLFAGNSHQGKGQTMFDIQTFGRIYFGKYFKNGVLHVKPHLKPELVFTDDHGTYVGIEVTLSGVKALLMGIYTPNEDKGMLYKQLMFKLLLWLLVSDRILEWSGIPRGRQNYLKKNIKDAQGKLPKTLFELMENLDMVDLWRQKNLLIFQNELETTIRW